MLTEEQIKQALHASRVVPLGVAQPHGPLGLEQLAEAVARVRAAHNQPQPDRIERPIALPVSTWQKLDALARSASKPDRSPVAASEVAAALLERALNPS